MEYLLTDWRAAADEGREPDLPEAWGFLVLFDLEDNCLVQTRERVPDDHPRRVPLALHTLIDAAKGYPPALARAKHRICKRGPGLPTRLDAATIAMALREELDRQPTDRAVLAKSGVDEVGYRCGGEYVWILGMSSDGERVSWVADDFHVYTDLASGFELTEVHLARLHADTA